MKKIIAALLMIMMTFSLTGCATSSAPKVQKVTEPAEPEKISYKSYDDTLEGLCEYMAALGYAYALPNSTGDEITDPVKMDAAIIGADAGYKFNYKTGSKTVTVEYYVYSDFNCDDYKQAKEEGKITIELDDNFDNQEFDVTLSDNGKYMMIYNPSKEDVEYDNALIEAFKGFYA